MEPLRSPATNVARLEQLICQSGNPSASTFETGLLLAWAYVGNVGMGRASATRVTVKPGDWRRGSVERHLLRREADNIASVR